MGALDDIQGALVAAWAADAPLKLLIGEGAIFDAPPRGMQPPYVTILRHDAVPRDGDETPGFEHRLTIHCWSPQPSRSAALEIAHRIERVAVMGAVAPSGHRVSILDGPDTVRTVQVSAAGLVYAEAEQIADFGALPAGFGFSVEQISPVLGAGHKAQGVFP